MATSSFKSTTRRGGTTTRTESNLSHNHKSNPNPSHEKRSTKKAPLRRSQSVSAISRTKPDFSSEFLNKIDNPLFSTAYDKEEVEPPLRPKTVVSSSSSSSQRGRSVTRRNADLDSKKETFRNSSNAYSGGRRRSVSRSRSVASDESSVELSIWEDATSLSETEVKTIKAVWEQTKSLTSDDSKDYMPNDGIDMANPVPVDDDDIVLLDYRRDYARKLNECHERARRLRADLAAEENHEHELSRILKDILSEPMTTTNVNVRSSPAQRKKSIERRKMSRTLAEEAMTYFDECVSISTFDSSDFSATEDAATSVSASNNCPVSSFGHIQEPPMFDRAIHKHNPLESNSVASSSTKTCLDQNGCKLSELGMKFQLSIDDNISDNLKDIGKNLVLDDMEKRRSGFFNIDDYKLCSLAEELPYERVLQRNRIESGNLHLCGGGGISMASLHSFLL